MQKPHSSFTRWLLVISIFSAFAFWVMAQSPHHLVTAATLAPAVPQGGGSRTIRLPANALNYDATNANITQTDFGLTWQSNSLGEAYLVIPKPIGWDNTYTVTLNLYFAPTTDTAGNVDFIIQPRAYNPGDTFTDSASLNGTPVAVNQQDKITRQTFDIIPSYFGNGSLWVITLQRNGAQETYVDPLILYSVELIYIPEFPLTTTGQTSFPANAVNFNSSSSIITQGPVGLTWDPTFADSANLTIPRPREWDGNSDVTFRAYFRTTSNASGLVDFFIRPAGYSDGDTFAGAGSIGSPGVPVAALHQLQIQDIVIPADRFANKDLWLITIQRDGTEETYPDPIEVVAFDLIYTKKTLPFFEQTSFPAQALNFRKNSAIITSNSLGLLWQNDFQQGAYLMVQAPNGWAFNRDMELHLFMMPDTDTAGEMAFFIRPRAFLPGDIFGDVPSLETTSVSASGRYDIREQIFTIPAASFNSKNFWVITLQREAANDTYPDNLILLAAELRPKDFQTTLPLINRP